MFRESPDLQIAEFDDGLRPGLAYLHGGGWTIFSIDTHDRIMREYSPRAGVVVTGVDHSLSPESRFPRGIEETVAVVRRLRAKGTFRLPEQTYRITRRYYARLLFGEAQGKGG
jgi:acetyl esterase/lipase